MEISPSIGLVGYLISGIVFVFLLTVYFLGFRKRKVSKQFVLLLLASIIWSLISALSQIGPSIPFEMIVISDLIRTFTWIYVLQTAIGIYQEKSIWNDGFNPFSRRNILIIFIISLLIAIFEGQLTSLTGTHPLVIPVSILLIFDVIGLMLIEVLYRNTPKINRTIILYLCISAGGIFIYDFFVFSNALLIRSIDYQFWSIRGFINVLIAPTLAIAAVRNPSLAPELHVSRQFVFHSSTALAVGIYLFVMSLVGFYIKESSGEWGKVLQTLFLFGALLLLGLILFSSSIKLRIQRYLSTSFRHKYDYRVEWNRFSDTLLKQDNKVSIYNRALKAVAQVVDSKGASLWLLDHNAYVYKTFWRQRIDNPEAELDNSELISLLKKEKKLVTKDDFPKQKKTLSSQHWFMRLENSWMILPLWLDKTLYGFIHLREPIVPLNLDIEDTDLLNTLAHHVTIALFSKSVDEELHRAQQFKNISQMTAFLVHDLKTVLSQLNLLVENSQKHKSNPVFVDDMINTVEHTTKKMTHLLGQLKNPESEVEAKKININEMMEAIVSNCNQQLFRPVLINNLDRDCFLFCKPSEFQSAINHIIQNAIESLDKSGSVIVSLDLEKDDVLKITISDTGVGMTQEFVANRLFSPFETTKGVSGMGVGVYQSRETIRELEGDISVKSTPGEGTSFSITLPVQYA